jgi:hypothetical protein
MIATLQFSLPEEQAEYVAATRGAAYRAALDELKQKFRNNTKYLEDQGTTWGAARELLLETISECLEDDT